MKTYRQFIAEAQRLLEPYGTTPHLRDLCSRILQLLRNCKDWPQHEDLQQALQNLQKKYDQLQIMDKQKEAKTVRWIAQQLEAARTPPTPA